MRAVIQRVSRASVAIEGKITAQINHGLLILLGIEETDTMDDVDWLCGKITRLRVFPDDEGVMNLSIMEASGEILVVSQFTLHASTKKGNRPSYIRAARPEIAVPLYETFIQKMAASLGKRVPSGVFGAMMQIELINNGPVTIIMDSKNKE